MKGGAAGTVIGGCAEAGGAVLSGGRYRGERRTTASAAGGCAGAGGAARAHFLFIT